MIAVTLPDTAYVVVADYSQGIDSAKPKKCQRYFNSPTVRLSCLQNHMD